MKRIIFALLLFTCAVPAFAAAPAIVQSKCAYVALINGQTLTFDSQPVIGNALGVLAGGVSFSGVGSSIITGFTDNHSGSYSLEVGEVFDSGYSTRGTIGSAIITATGVTYTVTAAVNDGGTLYTNWCIVEWSGNAASSIADKHNSTHTNPTPATVTNSGASATNNSMVFSTIGAWDGSGPTVNTPTGFTKLDDGAATFSGAYYRIITASETSAAAYTAGTSAAVLTISNYKGIDAAAATGGSNRLQLGVGR